MQKTIKLLIILTATILLPLNINAEFKANPQTPYAQTFIQTAGKEQWFLNQIEKYLNQEQKTINNLHSKEDLKNITSLGLSNQNIQGKIPSTIGELTNLKYLYLSDNNITSPLPKELYTLTNLQNLDLSNNNLTGTIPEELGTMPNLKILNLKQNIYEGNIPSTIQNNKTITNLNLMENNLTGGIPSGINNMTALQYLNLSQNNLGGTIPNLENLTNLKALSLWYTNLKGEINPSIYNLNKLQILDLAENALEGNLSENIGNLTKLQHLTIADNKIKGQIPQNIEKLTELQTINLSSNLLRGIVPDVFTMPKIKEIDIKNNYLRGHLPQSIKTAYQNKAVIYAQNNYLTGENLKLIQNNEHNFLDKEGNQQYQLTIEENQIKIQQDKDTNIHQKLKNLNLTTNNTTQKIKLNPDEYNIIDNNNPSKIQITTTNKINIKALEEIKQTENYKIQIKIKDNTNSNYSKIDIKLTTEEITSGGGGGGGTIPNPNPIPPTPEQIQTPNQTTTNHKAYIKGYQDKSFRPNNNITREETSAMLITAMDITPKKSYASKYNDVEKNRWSINHIEEARKRSYLIGYQDNLFKPENSITRAELAAALVSINQAENLVQTNTQKPSKDFKDIKEDQWYYQHIKTAENLGLIAGYQDNTFRPNQKVTRAEAVTMINQMLNRNSDTLNLNLITNPFSDVKTTHWAYKQILEAATNHIH